MDIIKTLIILFLAIIFTFNNEIVKTILKEYSKKNYINKDKCFKIMSEIDDILKKYKIKYYFSEGTALGLYRDGDLIDWDDDIDIAMEEKEYKLFLKKCLPELVNRGYYLLYVYSGHINRNFLHLIKYGHLIDIENIINNKKCISKIGEPCNELLPHIQKLTEKEWRGRRFPVPEESYYVYLYGKNWKVPRKTKDQKNV